VTCVACGAVATGDALGWRAYRTDLPPEAEAEDADADELPTVVYYCPDCAAREFG
jgi:hypothetical protein